MSMKDLAFQVQMLDLAGQEDRLRRFELDMDFQRAMVASAHHPRLVETHDQYNTRIWRARFVSSQQRSNRKQRMARHQGIVAALQRRDAAAASPALIDHRQSAIDDITAARLELQLDPVA